MSIQYSYAILKENFTADQIEVTYTPTSNRFIESSIEDSLEELWTQQLKTAQQKGMQLYDSEAYRLNGFRNSAGHLSLELAPINYKTHAAMKTLYNDPRITEKHLDKTFVADSLIKTTDGKYILGKVDKVVENDVYLIGGTCAKSRAEISSASDLFKYARKRTTQILNVAESTVVAQSLIGIVQHEIGCVSAVFDTRVALSSSEVMAAFRPNNSVGELIVVEESNIRSYLAEGEGYMVAVADLLLP